MITFASPPAAQPSGDPAPAAADPAKPATPAAGDPPAAGAGDPQGGKPAEKPKWMKQLDGDLQENDFLAQFESFSGPARKLLELEGKRDRLVEIPGEDATDEIKAEYRKKFGIPAKAEEVALKLPQLPATAQWVEADLQEFRQFAVEAGLSLKQAQALIEFDARRAIRKHELQTAMTQARVKAERDADAALDRELKSELGIHYDLSKTRARENLNKVFSPAFVEVLGKAGILDSAAAFREMLALEKRLGDTPFLRSGLSAVTGGKSPIKGLENVRTVTN